MSHINIHPAPGLGDMVAGWFAVPNNPIKDGQSAVGIGYVPHIGELIPGKFAIPENPVIRGLSGCGMGYCSNSTKSLGELVAAGFPVPQNPIRAGAGMGAWYNDLWTSVESTATDLVPQTADWKWYQWAGVALGAVALVLIMTPGGAGYRTAKAQARQSYMDRMAQAKSAHRGFRRFGRTIGEASTG